MSAGRRDPGVLSALGETLARLGRRDQAEAMFHDLLTSNPDDAVVYVARGMTRLESDPPVLAEDFTAALRQAPHNALAHYGIARLTRTNDPHGAVKHLDTAIESDPDLVDAVQLLRPGASPAWSIERRSTTWISWSRRQPPNACTMLPVPGIYAETAHDLENGGAVNPASRARVQGRLLDPVRHVRPRPEGPPESSRVRPLDLATLVSVPVHPRPPPKRRKPTLTGY